MQSNTPCKKAPPALLEVFSRSGLVLAVGARRKLDNTGAVLISGILRSTNSEGNTDFPPQAESLLRRRLQA